MKKLLLLVGLIAATAFTSYITTTIQIKQVGPYYFSQTNFDSANVNGVGGVVKTYLAGDSERIGQIVYVSAKNTVKTDTIVASYNAIAGVVVGGAKTSMQGSIAVGDTSTLAAVSGQKVLVLERGRFWVLVDSGPGIAPGKTIVPSSRSNQRGRITVKAAALDSLNRVFGKLVDTAIAGKAALANINVR